MPAAAGMSGALLLTSMCGLLLDLRHDFERVVERRATRTPRLLLLLLTGRLTLTTAIGVARLTWLRHFEAVERQVLLGQAMAKRRLIALQPLADNGRIGLDSRDDLLTAIRANAGEFIVVADLESKDPSDMDVRAAI